MNNPTKRLWWGLATLFVLSFGALLFIGADIYRKAPPVPAQVVTESGQVVYTRDDIQTGRQVWQTLGGHQLGSIWGHGSYVAPDWTADWIHREAGALLDHWATTEYGESFATLPQETQARLENRLRGEVRSNGYNADTDTITVSDERAASITQVASHYQAVFGGDPAMQYLREQYAIAEDPLKNPEHAQQLSAFFFWTAWAAVTERPDADISYTSNWPYDPQVGNVPTAGMGMWSLISVILLIGGIAGLLWHHLRTHRESPRPTPPAQDPFLHQEPTPSMRATRKYFYTVVAMFMAQILLGIVTAHYAVEGQQFYGVAISDLFPYALTRTWHTQLGIFWIATAWLACGLYIAPALSGKEPRFQRFGVNLLYVALLIVVVGSFVGEWLGVQQAFNLDVNFYLGHQGYEYVDLGRVWQILLFAGLVIWLTLVGRALWPALQRKDETRSLVWITFLSTIAIGLFYAAGLTWGKHTHLSMIEYWRWWVVHLWVEGFFEVFATAVIALIFVRLGLVRARSATSATLFATIVFLFGGILGTLHHLYFTGTPTSVIAVGAVFSALEVVPLALIGFEALDTYRHTRAGPHADPWKWPILCFVAVAFWNLVGAGLLGFLINPPISLYFTQGLNLTPTHGHAALFGVYGMLGIGLMLFCLRGLCSQQQWPEALMARSFWLLNIGLVGMVFMSLFPAGLYQLYHAITSGYWFARSPEVIHSATMETLVWLRVPGDTIFAIGAIYLARFMLKLRQRPALKTPVAAQQATT